MAELNREQIIKALECCFVICYCNTCPYYKVGEHTQICTRKMAKDALALIKELAEKIDDLEYTLEVQGDNLANAREGWNDAECKVEKLTEENERLKQAHDMLNESYDHLEKTKDELLAERSRLVGESEKIGIDNFDLICELSRIKEDTVREFAERIKTRMDDFARKGSGEYTYYLISKSVIDQIAKKMLEVNDAAE